MIHICHMGEQLECRIVLRYRTDNFRMGMYDPLNNRYEPLGEHPIRDAEKVIGGLKRAIEQQRHLLTFSEQSER